MARKVTDIRMYDIGVGGFSDKSKWDEIPFPKPLKKRLLRKINFLNRLPFTLAIKFIKL